jgi:hypothetical protein
MVLLLLFSSDEDGCLGLDGVRVQLPLMSGAEPLGHTVVWHLPLMSCAEPLVLVCDLALILGETCLLR